MSRIKCLLAKLVVSFGKSNACGHIGNEWDGYPAVVTESCIAVVRLILNEVDSVFPHPKIRFPSL